MRNAYCAQRLDGLRRTIEMAGRKPPLPTFKHIDYHPSWGGWRVQLPGIVGGGITYFSIAEYGNSESALIEAQYHRDDAYAKVGLDPYMRVRQRFSKRQRNQLLCIQEISDPRRGGAMYIVGSWQAQINGAVRQVKVRRQFGTLRTRQEAWDIVEAAVKAGLAEEAAREKAVQPKGIFDAR
jgi:hypothetical protein